MDSLDNAWLTSSCRICLVYSPGGLWVIIRSKCFVIGMSNNNANCFGGHPGHIPESELVCLLFSFYLEFFNSVSSSFKSTVA